MIVWLVGTVLVLALVFAALAPLESLRWWSTRGSLEARETVAELTRAEESGTGGAPPGRYLVYLSGVGVIDGQSTSGRERAFLEDVARRVPEIRVVDEVFPYATDNRGLPQRTTAWLWDRLARLRIRRRTSIAPNLINLRNTLQVLVSADPRYGPTFNIGVAQEIWRALIRHGYARGCGAPVTLVGYSGGAQMAVGAAWFLAMLDVPTSVICIGGIFSDDPGLDQIEHLWDLRGTRDRLRWLGPIAFPGRWPIARLSTWNRARHDRRVTVTTLGPMTHDGRGSYFDRRVSLPDGRTFGEATTDAVVAILTASTAPAGPASG